MQPSLSLGISPCPNDTFIFHGLIHGVAPVNPGFTLSEVLLEDVEQLNGRAARGELDVVKMSLAAIAQAARHYVVLESGAALGRGCGPLLVVRKGAACGTRPAELALPGRRTTAALLAHMAGVGGKRVYLRYDEVLPAVAGGKVEAGVVIHEGRFTFADYGLECVMDFGKWWEDRFDLPLPLGVIAARRSLGPQLIETVAEAIRQSLAHAFAHPEASRAYVARHAQELSAEVTACHINTFVSDMSVNMGVEGKKAVEALALAAFELDGRNPPQGGLFA